jgi:hypothetical protein
MSKHLKRVKPTRDDTANNPMIGGSKGVTRSGTSPDELEDLAGANTIEGDVENDTNPQGGVNKHDSRDRDPRRRP